MNFNLVLQKKKRQIFEMLDGMLQLIATVAVNSIVKTNMSFKKIMENVPRFSVHH